MRRSRTTAVILVAFVALSAMLASAAGTLMITANGATASLMRQARTPHLLQMHAGQVDHDRLRDFAENNPHVEQWIAAPMLNVDGAAIRVTGDDGTDTNLAAGLQDNSFVTQNTEFDFLLDTDGQVIDPEPGTVWLPLFYQQSLDLGVNQTVTVSGPGEPITLRVAGFLRDSQMNASYASSKRLLVSQTDFDALALALGEAGSIEYLIEFRLDNPADVSSFDTQYREAGLEANGPTITWTLFALINSLSSGITAAVVATVTLLLVAIAFLCVRFTLMTTIEQDYREIGVLKALGVRHRDLSRMYSRRYLVMAAAGAGIGFLASLGLSRVLLRDIELYMGPAGRTVQSLLTSLVLSAVIVLVIALAVRRTLRRLAKVSPVQAIRTGSASQKPVRRAPRWLSIGAGRFNTNDLLGLGDVLRRPGLYVLPLVIYTLAAFILVVPQNLHTTVTRPDFITYMGAGVSDMRIDVPQSAGLDRVREVDQQLAIDPQVSRHTLLTTASYTSTGADGGRVTVKVESGDLAAFPVTYLSGRAPESDADLGLSALQAAALGASLGSQVTLTPVRAANGASQQVVLTVTGIYQDLTNGGQTAKMLRAHTSADVMWNILFADFIEGTDQTATIAAYTQAHPDVKVSSVSVYVNATLGGTISALQGVAAVSFVVGVLVAVLITALFMRMLMVRDGFSIAAMKALGFRNSDVHRQYVVRSLAVLVVGIVLGVVLANTLGGTLAGLMLSSIGLSQLHLVANPWLAYLASPLVLVAAVVIATLVSTRPSDKYSISQTIKE